MIMTKPIMENTGKRMDICQYSDKNHAITIICWLLAEVLSSGGDGDGIWYTKYFTLESIEKLIKSDIDYSPWTITHHDDFISIGSGEEWLIITDNKDVFDNRPFWQQVSLIW